VDLGQRVEQALARHSNGIRPFDGTSDGYVVESWGRRAVSVRWQVTHTIAHTSLMEPKQLQVCARILQEDGFNVQGMYGSDRVHRLIVTE
jgi:hypothetical protein